jgi:hypothetical protein
MISSSLINCNANFFGVTLLDHLSRSRRMTSSPFLRFCPNSECKEQEGYTERLMSFYKKFAPMKARLPKIQKILVKYKV